MDCRLQSGCEMLQSILCVKLHSSTPWLKVFHVSGSRMSRLMIEERIPRILRIQDLKKVHSGFIREQDLFSCLSR